MKKLLRIPIAIILLLGVGFVYLVKNPELPLSQKVLNTIGIPTTVQQIAPEQANTDLTNCISYFDGCNRCSMKDGKPEACTEMYCETPGEPKCLEYGTPDGSAGLANPASVNCESNGGNLEIVTSADGSQLGMCTLPDGTVCEERAYMRGECGTTNDGGGSSPSNPGNGGSDGTVCTMEYAPVCASVAIQCIKAPCYPIEQTFSNQCVMEQNKLATYLHNGECGTATDCPQRSQPSPDFCPSGAIVDGGKDSNGCQLPPNCVTK